LYKRFLSITDNFIKSILDLYDKMIKL